jgi:hypothetical protein
MGQRNVKYSRVTGIYREKLLFPTPSMTKNIRSSNGLRTNPVPGHGKFFASERELNRPKRECPGISIIGAKRGRAPRREGSYRSLNQMVADDLD